MTTQDILGMIRRLAAEVDESTSEYTDSELLELVEDVRVVREVSGIASFGDYTVGTVQNQPGYGIVPEPTNIDGVILAHGVAVRVLEDTFRGRLSRGEIGTSWTSGLEAESSISAAATYQTLIKGLQRALDKLIIIRRAGSAGLRVQ